MSEKDTSFLPDHGLEHAIDLLRRPSATQVELPHTLPALGMGEREALELLAPHVLGRAAHLDSIHAFAHMDPPTPWITWATALWNARLNQNLLHPATAPFALGAEKIVIEWLLPFFGMNGGHMCSGSTIANITALWAAREAKGIKKVIASEAAHLSILKAANILGLQYEQVETDDYGQLNREKLRDVSEACLVLTAGTTATGAIDPLSLAGQAKWTHVDAAWAGPLRLSPTYAHLLNGVEQADSVAVSAHKWLFQPKDSALIMFREPEIANPAISFGGGYLAASNIGVQGSRGAAAVPLLATMLAWGRDGLVARIERAMQMATYLAHELNREDDIVLWAMPKTGVTVFRSRSIDTKAFYRALPEGMLSTCMLDDVAWLRSVAANPLADVEKIVLAISDVIRGIEA